MLANDTLDEFKLECELRRLSARTIKGYYNNTRQFLTWLERQHKITELETIRSQHIKMYMQFLIKKQLTPSYINSILRCLRAFFRFAVDEGYLVTNPASKLNWQKQGKVIINTFTDEEVQSLLEVFDFRKWYATEIYKSNGYDIVLVQRLLQHSSAATTQRYIGIEPQRIEVAIQKHSLLL